MRNKIFHLLLKYTKILRGINMMDVFDIVIYFANYIKIIRITKDICFLTFCIM